AEAVVLVVARAGSDAAFEVICNVFRNDANGAARAVPTVQRSLRALEHFDALDVREVEHGRGCIGHVAVIDIRCDARLETTAGQARSHATQIRLAVGSRVVVDEPGCGRLQCLSAGNAELLQVLARESGHRDGDVLQTFGALLRRDDDFFYACGVLRNSRLPGRDRQSANGGCENSFADAVSFDVHRVS